jgi:hypothetical protein
LASDSANHHLLPFDLAQRVVLDHHHFHRELVLEYALAWFVEKRVTG